LDGVNGGEFTLLVEADSAEEAIEKFRNLINNLDDSFESFGSVGDVYLHNASEIREMPAEGVLSYFTERSQGMMASISTALPGVDPEHVAGFDWGHNEVDEDGGVTPRPFVHALVDDESTRLNARGWAPQRRTGAFLRGYIGLFSDNRILSRA